MAFKVSRGGCAFLGHVLPGVKANCYFKLIFKDAEILQIDPIQFLPFSWMVGNLLLQPKYEDRLNLKSIKSVLGSETSLNVAWEWVKPLSVLIFADCLQHGSSHSSLHSWHCGPSYRQDSIAHHLTYCILCGDSSAFCGLVQEISKADEGSCSLTVTWKRKFSLVQVGALWWGSSFLLSEFLRHTKYLAKSKKYHFRTTQLEVHCFDANLCLLTIPC